MTSSTQQTTDRGMVDTRVFDPTALALRQDFTVMIGLQRKSVTIPIRKPPKQAFFSAHPAQDYRIQIPVLTIHDTGEHFIVAPELLDELQGEWTPRLLVACQTRTGSNFFWPVKLPDADGQLDTWNASAMAIIDRHANTWIRLKSNRETATYEALLPISPPSSPVWSMSAKDMMTLAFEHVIIDSLDHPVIRSLRGAE